MVVLRRIYHFLVVIIGISKAAKVLHHPSRGPIALQFSDPEVPALGIKCNTAELKIVNQVVEKCLEEVLEESSIQALDACQVMERSESCLEMRSTCLDHKTLREFKDSMLDVYMMHGVNSCSLVQEYISSQRPTQLISSNICEPWQLFEIDWNYRYCISDIVRKAIISRQKLEDAFKFNKEDIFSHEDSEVDLTDYEDHFITFCDFSQILMDCGRSLHPCYEDNLEEVEILKFLNTMYWMSEYEQPFLQFSQMAGVTGLKEIVYIVEYVQGQLCDLSQAEDIQLVIEDFNDGDGEVVYYFQNEEL